MLSFEWVHAAENNNDRILKFLREIDDTMIPVLSGRVELEAYAAKLADRAETLFVCNDNEDIAACSVYCNTENAFISSIAVKTEFRRKHIGFEIMERTKQYVSENGCRSILLDVYGTNENAIMFYRRNGFRIIESKNNWLKMGWNYNE